MEDNVSNALLMAVAMIIFVIALTVTFSLISQTNTTSDIVLYSYDEKHRLQCCSLRQRCSEGL